MFKAIREGVQHFYLQLLVWDLIWKIEVYAILYCHETKFHLILRYNQLCEKFSIQTYGR